MKVFSKYLNISLISYLLLLVVETLWRLFQLRAEQSGSITTLLGVKIDNVRTAHNLATTFGLTHRFFVIIAAIVVVNLIVVNFKK